MPKLVDVTTTLWGMEYSVHEVPKSHRDEVAAVFPGMDMTGALVVPTCQQSRLDLVNVGPDIEAEKDYCLERFMSWASQVCDTLVARGFWADFIDPCSGLPMRSKVNGGVYPEVQALSTLLNYRTSNAGCCRVVLHPKWATSVYPASLFAKAPLEELLAAIREAEAKLGGASHEAG